MILYNQPYAFWLANIVLANQYLRKSQFHLKQVVWLVESYKNPIQHNEQKFNQHRPNDVEYTANYLDNDHVTENAHIKFSVYICFLNIFVNIKYADFTLKIYGASCCKWYLDLLCIHKWYHCETQYCMWYLRDPMLHVIYLRLNIVHEIFLRPNIVCDI